VKEGRELDALVAEKVMGETVFPDYGEFNARGVKPYSTDIAAAWQVVEKLGLFSRGFKWREIETLGALLQHNPRTDRWAVIVRYYDGDADVAADNCDTAPHAICLAALKAIGRL
jgi:hypothetical protein